ncbi:MAG: MFS transporter [bacterium]|nr:MFS transporter [bacterium]
MKKEVPILGRLFRAALFKDAGFFLILGALPYKIMDLGGDSVALGVVPAVSTLAYIILTHFTGRLSDRMDRFRMIRYGLLAIILFSALAFKAASIASLMLMMPVLALGAALFWPAIQALTGSFSNSDRDLARNIGRLNVYWSIGKSLGFLVCGLLLAHYGFRNTFLAGIGLTALAFFSLPRDTFRYTDIDEAEIPVALDEPVEEVAGDTEPAVPGDVRRRFRQMAWLANFATYGAVAVLSYQLPEWFESLGWSSIRFGLFLAVIFIGQTLAFVLLSERVRFAYSAKRLIMPQFATALALLALPFIHNYLLLMLLVPLLGGCVGVCYTASIYYSLHTDEDQGRNAGIHEALLGLGAFLLPLLGGIAVRMSGQLAAPYILAGVTVLIAATVQLYWSRQ